MKKKRKAMGVLLASAIAATAFAGCADKNDAEPDKSAAPSAETGNGGNSLPITDKPITIKWYQTNFASGVLQTMGESEGFKEIEKRTGIHIEWQHPSSNDQLNVMLASGEYPDVIFWNWSGVPGGLQGLIDKEVAIELNDLIDKYVPNYKNLLDKYPEVKKYTMLDDGTYPSFFQLDPDPERTTYVGHMLRKDWLDKLGLKQPTTIDEWYTTLKAFKEKDPNGNGKADEIPYGTSKESFMASEFAAAWGILDGFYKDPQSGKIAYGPAQPQYKEYLATMAKWYKEGLIDPEYASIDNKSLNAKIQGDLVGSTYGYVGASLGNNTKAARAKLPNFTLTGVTPPIGPSGKAYNHAADRIQKVGLSAVITKTSKYQKEIAQLMNYLYSEEGQTLLNWGIEDKSYTVDNGKKQFSDSILKNTEGKAPAQAVFQYAFPAQGFTKVMDFEPYKQINLSLPEQVEAVQNWAKGDIGLNVPTLSFNSEESSKLPTIMNDINTYKSEMVTKFIMGVEPIDKFDEFAKKIKDMKIDEATKINQAAFDRFNARK